MGEWGTGKKITREETDLKHIFQPVFALMIAHALSKYPEPEKQGRAILDRAEHLAQV
jgi:hypothetical protein